MTKTIAIKDDVYKKLLMVKRGGESFSDLFERTNVLNKPLETLKKLRGCVEFRGRLKIRKPCLTRLMRQGLSVGYDNFGLKHLEQ